MYRTDQSAQTSVRMGLGDCLIAISKKLMSSPIHLNINEVEHLFVKVSNHLRNSLSGSRWVGMTYISQEGDIEKYSTHTTGVEMLASRFPDYKLLLCVDYNLPNIVWPLDELFHFTADLGRVKSIIQKATCINDSFVSL